jgi:hypothetical protein
MNQYLSLLGLLIFVVFVGGIGLLAAHAKQTQLREDEEHRRKLRQ